MKKKIHRRFLCNAVTIWILYHLGLLFWWELYIVCLLFGQPWGINVPICLALCYLRLKLKHTFTESSLLSFHYLIFHCLSFLLWRVQTVCVNGTPFCFVVDPLQTQLCLTRMLLLSIDIDRASFWVSESYCTFYFYFSILSPLSTHPHSLSSLFCKTTKHLTILFFLFILSLFLILILQSAKLSCPQWADYMWGGQYNLFFIPFTAYPVQYYRLVHIRPISCFQLGYEAIAFLRVGFNSVCTAVIFVVQNWLHLLSLIQLLI